MPTTWAAGYISLEQARAVAERMHTHSPGAAIGAAPNYDFKGIGRVLDVGAGSGCFMIAMAQKHPYPRCTIMDLPAMCEAARDYIKTGEVSDRVDTVAVDMFRQPAERLRRSFFSSVYYSITTGYKR